MSIPPRMLTRRRLLVRSAQAAGLLAGAWPWAPLLAGQRARGFKIGACDWSLDKRCDPAAFDVARQIGLDGVQVDLGSPSNQMRLRRPEVQAEFLKAAKRTGLEIAALAIVETNDVPLKSDPRAAGWLADAVDVCKALGVRVVMPACFGAGDLDMRKTAEIDQLVRVLKSAGAKAEKRGVVIGVESYLSAEENRRLLDRVGSPAVKVYYDVGNSTDKGRDVCREIRASATLFASSTSRTATTCSDRAGSISSGFARRSTTSIIAAGFRSRRRRRTV